MKKTLVVFVAILTVAFSTGTALAKPSQGQGGGIDTAKGVQKKVPVQISNVMATTTSSSSASINWDTNKAADSLVTYWFGTTTSTSTLTVYSATASTGHMMILDNLASSTTYSYFVTSKDLYGNSASSSIGTFELIVASSSPQYPNIPTSYSSPTYTKYYPSLTYVDTIAGLNDPAGIAVRTDGVIFVADYHNDQVKIYDSNYELIKTLGSTRGSAPGQFSEPWDIAFDSDSNAYITDTNNGRVQVFDINGDFIREFSASDPQGIAINSDDYVYVSGRTPEVFTTDGTSLGKIPVPSNRYPRNIAIDAQDGVHFSNIGNASLSPGENFYRYENNSLTLNQPNGEDILERKLDFQPLFIDVDDMNRIWVTDHTNGKVHVYDYDAERLIQSTFIVSSTTNLTTENPKGIEVHGNLLFVSSDLTDDVRIYQVSNILATTSPDTVAPELVSVETTTFKDGVKIFVRAEDESSEVNNVQYWLRNEVADHNIIFSGDLIESATLRSVIFESFPVNGTWKVHRVRISDSVGNTREYYHGTDYTAEFLIP